MRLLHTSDWHLGRSLHRADLGPAQEAFVDHLVETVRAERVDVVLIAGDVYDRAVPPLESIGLFEQALRRLRAVGAQVIAISGNHDSPLRLGVNAALLEGAGVFLRTRVADCGRPILLADRHGPVAVHALPYLEPDAVRAALGPEVGRSHEAVLGAAMQRVRTDLAGRDPRRSVLLSHGWVRGGVASESERDITVGGAGAVPADLFDGLGWVALGHLHGPQRLADHLAYSGSPLAYSFSEAAHRKGSWLIELGAAGVTDVSFVPAPVHRRLAKVRDELSALLTAGRYAVDEDNFLAVTLTDPVRPPQAMDRLRARFPHVLTLLWDPPCGTADAGSYAERLHDRDDQQIAEGFVEHVRGEAASATERILLADALTAVRRTEAA
ncbi:MAG TPA: exonuclease SbcCD subunit D [Mycobacteriales bacterium]|nr:exonuclease SbcCD subunit D [Mycobacteriales bacterium]